MGLTEGCGGPSTSSAPAFRGGLQTVPAAEASQTVVGIPSPRDFVDFMRRQHDAAGNSPAHNGTRSRRSASRKRDTTSTTGSKERENQRLKLVKTPIHDAIAAEIEQRPPEWITILQRLMEQPFNRNNINGIQGRLAELHVDQVLRRLAKLDEFRGLVQINSLDGDAKAGSISFRRGKQGGVYADLGDKGSLAEYDNAFLVGRSDENRTPTAIEVKALNSSKGTDSFLEEGHWRHFMYPFKQRYGNRASLMYVTTREGIDPSSDALQKFQASGGYVVIMKPTLSDFREVAEAISASTGKTIDLPGPRIPGAKK